MFRGLFKKHATDEDIFEVDPVVEQRRKEKFSTPLIYDEEFKEEKVIPEPVEIKEEKAIEPVIKPKEKIRVERKKEVIKEAPIYQMSEVISPMRGVTKSKKVETVKPQRQRPKVKKNVDQLVPVISPYFGNYEEKKPIESQAKLTAIEKEASEVEPNLLQEGNDLNKSDSISKQDNSSVNKERLPTVEDNLRNIAKIVEEEKDQLKIIEERTGEFKLDFSTMDNEKQSSLIDEVDDNMSLDELMNLYEKKFKD